MPLTARTGYLFHQVGIDPAQDSAPIILAVKSRALRELIRRWWEALEPEATAGVTTSMMEEALAAFAEKAMEKRDFSFARRWAQAWFDWKPRLLQSNVERIVGERFLTSMERLGVLVGASSARVAFAHFVLPELYLGLGHLLKQKPLAELTIPSRVSMLPLRMPQVRVVLARLNFTPPAQREAAFREVVRRNLHLATWFLYGDADARAEHGAWLAAEIFTELHWNIAEADRGPLEACLESLDAPALAACRTLLDERSQSLPAHLAAAQFLARHGTTEDLPRLERLAADPQLGQWEIEAGRRLLRDAQASVLDADVQKRYSRQERVELAKQTAAIVLQVAGAVTQAAFDAKQWNRDAAIHFVGGLAEASGAELANVSESDFYRTQSLLRSLIAFLPAEIERRKIDIQRLAPAVRAAALEAMRAVNTRA